jgi:hypothetical protein
LVAVVSVAAGCAGPGEAAPPNPTGRPPAGAPPFAARPPADEPDPPPADPPDSAPPDKPDPPDAPAVPGPRGESFSFEKDTEETLGVELVGKDRRSVTVRAPADVAVVGLVDVPAVVTREAGDSGVTWGWLSTRPLRSVRLLAGRRTTIERPAGRVLLAVHLKAESASRAAGLLDAMEARLSACERLFGPFPATRFDLFEHFRPEPAAGVGAAALPAPTPSAVARALVRQWWGVGVRADPKGGDWTEAVAEWAETRLSPDPAGARAARAAALRRWSALGREDFPLARYRAEPRRDDPAVGADKGAAVIHLLARTVGEDRLLSALRRLAATRAARPGKPATWDDLRAECERAAGPGTDLSAFFRQWVAEAGGPELRLDSVRVEPDGPSFRLTGTLRQLGRVYSVAVPVVIRTPTVTRRIVVDATRREQPFEATLPDRPTEVLADPDFDIPRLLPPDGAESPTRVIVPKR